MRHGYTRIEFVYQRNYVVVALMLLLIGVAVALTINKMAKEEVPKQRMERVEYTCRGTCVSIWHDTVGGGYYLVHHNGGILEVPCEGE